MTKYILNSGGIGNAADRGAAFFNEIVNGFGSQPKLLFCFFAAPREEWEEKFQTYKTGFTELLSPEVQPSFELAFPEKFVTQVKAVDAVYLHGGDDHLVQYWLRKFDLPKIWEGKTVATNSASSNALSVSFWTCDWRQCMDGLGILPIKFLPHYKSEYGKDDPRGQIDWDEAYQKLSQYGDKSLPIYALKEGEYNVLEI